MGEQNFNVFLPHNTWSANGHPAGHKGIAVDPELRVLFIVPAYNEALTLPSLVRELQTLFPTCDVLVIDDGSTDQTRNVLKGLSARVISLPYRLGVGGAVQTGLHIALQEGYEVAVQVDADGQHPPQEVPKLLAAMRQSGGDLVLGSRFLVPLGYRSTFTRRLGIRLFSHLLSLICRARITDATSGFRAMNRRAIKLLATRYAEDYPEVEAILTVHKAGLRMIEVPVQMSERRAGHSSIGPLDSLQYLVKVTLTILMNLLRKQEPHDHD